MQYMVPLKKADPMGGKIVNGC